MKRSRLTQDHIIGILKEHEAGVYDVHQMFFWRLG